MGSSLITVKNWNSEIDKISLLKYDKDAYDDDTCPNDTDNILYISLGDGTTMQVCLKEVSDGERTHTSVLIPTNNGLRQVLLKDIRPDQIKNNMFKNTYNSERTASSLCDPLSPTITFGLILGLVGGVGIPSIGALALSKFILNRIAAAKKREEASEATELSEVTIVRTNSESTLDLDGLFSELELSGSESSGSESSGLDIEDIRDILRRARPFRPIVSNDRNSSSD